MRIRAGARPAHLLAVGLVAIALGACGEDDSGSSAGDSTEPATKPQQTGAVTTLSVDAVENGARLAFSREALKALPGEVTLLLFNKGDTQLQHAIEVEGNGVEKAGEPVAPGGSSTVTATLKAGKYTFYCPVGDHEQRGMKGTLTVR